MTKHGLIVLSSVYSIREVKVEVKEEVKEKVKEEVKVEAPPAENKGKEAKKGENGKDTSSSSTKMDTEAETQTPGGEKGKSEGAGAGAGAGAGEGEGGAKAMDTTETSTTPTGAGEGVKMQTVEEPKVKKPKFVMKKVKEDLKVDVYYVGGCTQKEMDNMFEIEVQMSNQVGLYLLPSKGAEDELTNICVYHYHYYYLLH